SAWLQQGVRRDAARDVHRGGRARRSHLPQAGVVLPPPRPVAPGRVRPRARPARACGAGTRRHSATSPVARRRTIGGHGESPAVAQRRPQPSARARAAVVPLRGHDAPILRALPSGRSLLVGFAIVAAVAGLYALARITPTFALD